MLKHVLFRPVPEHVLRHMLKHKIRQVLEHVPRHVLKHVLRHVPEQLPGQLLEHVPQNRHHDPPSSRGKEGVYIIKNRYMCYFVVYSYCIG